MRRHTARLTLAAALLAALLFGLVASPRAALAAGQPVATLTVPAEVPIGQSFTFQVAFDNTSAVDTGYGPFIDLIVPSRGADGAGAPDDGVSFLGATYLGQAVTATSLVFPAGGCVTHPYAKQIDGSYNQVCGTPGDTLVVLQLPFGSFTPSQPAVEIAVAAQLSANADLATALPIRARAGFQFGNDPLDNWCCDPVLLNPAGPSSSWPASSVTPVLFSLTKTYLGPEDETATGPNFPRRYQLSVDVAAGQSLTNLDLSDLLPPNLAFLGLISASPAGYSVRETPTVGAPAVAPNNDLVVRFPSVTGTTAAVDATLTVEFFVPRLDAAAAAVINPATGDDATAGNNATASGSWDPLDPRDPLSTPTASGVLVGPEHTLTPKSLAIQKAVAVVADTGAPGPSPGDTLEYTLAAQVSDFFAFGDLVVADRFSDGQRFDAGFAPTLQVAGNGFSSAAASFDPASFTVVLNADNNPATPASDGRTTVTFQLSDELLARGRPNGSLVGGCVDPVAGSATPSCAAYNDGATTATIVFRTVIQDSFSDTYPSGDASVDEGDTLSNDVTVTGDVLNTGSFAPTGSAEADGSGASVTIERGTIDKSIYAVNGSTSLANPVKVAAGDTVTYRLQATLPSSDIESLRLVDYLPLPIFSAGEFVPATTFINGPPSATAPPAGNASYGPADTFGAIYGGAPAVAVDGTSNALEFDFGSFDSVANTPSAIDILFSVTVRNEPTADGLFLTNQLRRFAGATNQPTVTDDDIVQVQITQPILRISKGVVGASNPAATLTAPAGPAGFAAPGSGGAPFSGTINSTNLITAPVNADVTGVDANDLVRFAIVIENQGSGLKGAYDVAITDTLPLGLTIPAGGLNLQVRNGAGTAIPFTPLGGGSAGPADDLFNNGIELVDTAAGACQSYHPTDGTNVVVITYDLQVDPAAQAGVPIVNRGTITSYAGEEGGTNHVPADNKPGDSATVYPDPTLAKSLVADSEAHSPAADVVIGEIARFRLAVQVPEGAWTAAQFVDQLPAGLRFLDDGSARVALVSDGGLSSSTLTDPAVAVAGSAPVAPSYALPDAAVSSSPSSDVDSYASGTDVYLSLGDLTNADNDDNAEYVVVELNALVENVAGNQAGTQLTNGLVVRRAGADLPVPAATTALRVVEPALQTAKAIVAPADAKADAGDSVTYRITLTNPAGATAATAFNLAVSDPVPAKLTLNPASVTLVSATGGVTAATAGSSGSTVTIAADSFPVGGQIVVEYSATVGSGVFPAETLTNTAASSWTSLPDANGTASNPTGSANSGTPGSDTGERTGSASPALNDYRATGSATLTVFVPAPVKTLVSSSEAHTAGANVAVGEIVRYRLAVNLAESTSPDFQLLDALPTGLTFLDDGSARVAFVSDASGISSSNPNLSGAGLHSTDPAVIPTFILPDEAVSSSPTADADSYASGTDVYFKLGDLVNANTDANSEFVVVEFNALVDNSVAGSNDRGDTRNNSFTVRIGGAQSGSPSANVTVTVQEPVLANLAKAVSTAPTDAGDTIAYRITYNTGSGTNRSTAFDVRLTDTLPADLSLNVASVNVTLSGGAAGITDSSAGNLVAVTIASVPVGASVQIDYTATVNANAANGRTINNTANLVYTSLPGANGTTTNSTGSSTPGAAGSPTGERDGSNGTAQPNDHSLTTSASSTLATPTIDKLTPSPLQYTIGELVTYDIRVTLPEGTTQGLVVSDNLPAGLAYVGHSIVTAAGTNLPAAYNGDVGSLGVTRTSPTVAPGASGEDLVLNFPTVTTANDNDTANNAFLVRLQARVLNVLANQDGTTLPNTAALSYTNPNSGATVNVADPTAETITVREPVVEIAKSILAAPSPADAGATIRYQLQIAHAAASSRPAYDLVVADALPAGLVNPSIVSVSAAGVAAPSAEIAGNAIRVPASADGSFDLPQGATVTVVFEAEIAATATPGQTIANTASVVWSSLDGASPDERSEGDGVADGSNLISSGALDNYEANSSASITVDQPTVAKALVATSEPGTPAADVTIGEVVEYAITITLPEGTTPSLQVVDSLPAGLAYVAGSYVVDTSGFSGALPAPTVTAVGGSGDDLTLDFGAIGVPNDNDAGNNSFVVRLQTRVLDLPGNSGLTPPGRTTLSNGASISVGGSPIVATPVDVAVVEPRITITKSFGAATGHAGETVQVTLLVANTGTAAAHDLIVEDPLPAASFSAVSEGTTPAGFSFGTTSAAGVTTVRYSGGSIPAGESRSFSFDVTLDAALAAGTTVNNTATVVQSTSLPGSAAGEREQPDTDASDSLLVAMPNLVLTKTDGGATATPGGAITFTLLYTNTGNQDAAGVTLQETVPANTSFDAAASSPGWSCAGTTPGSACTLSLGTVAAGASGSRDFVLRVDSPLPAGVTQVANAARIDDDGSNGLDQTPSDNADSDTTPITAAPDLVLTKTDGGATATPGGAITFTLLYTNTGNQDAAGVTLQETVPANTSFDAAASSPGWSCAGTAPGSACTYTVGSLAAGTSGSVDFVVTVDNPLPAGVTQVVNAALIADDGKETNTADNSDGETTPMGSAPELRIAKSDGEQFVRPGQILTYTLTIRNDGDRGASDVAVADTLPAGLAFLSASDGGTESGGVVSWPLFDLAAQAELQRTVTVQVDDPFPNAAGLIANSATVADDGSNGADPDLSNNSATDEDRVRPNLVLTKTDGGATAAPGATVTYTLHYTNTGGVDTSGVVIGETVPQHTSFDPADNAPGWSCAGTGPGSSCSYTLGDLAAGAAGSVDFVVRVASPLPADVTAIVNAARIADDGGRGTDLTGGDNSADVNTPTTGAPDLTLSKSDGGVSPLPGRPIAYTLSYGNFGTRGASGVVITETVPLHTSFDAAGSPGWSCAAPTAGATCTYDLGTVEGGASGQVTFTVIVTSQLPPGVVTIANSASIADNGANGSDPTANNSDDVTSNFSPTAVRLLQLAAAHSEGGVQLRWITGAEVNSFGFRLLRSATGRRADAVEVTTAVIPSRGSDSAGATYGYLDRGATAGVTYHYWLVAIDLDGATEEFGPATTAARPSAIFTVHLPLLAR